MQRIHETDDYALDYSGNGPQAYFVRLSDGAQSNLMQGDDVTQTIEHLNELGDYDNLTDTMKVAAFNSMAAEYFI